MGWVRRESSQDAAFALHYEPISSVLHYMSRGRTTMSVHFGPETVPTSATISKGEQAIYERMISTREHPSLREAIQFVERMTNELTLLPEQFGHRYYQLTESQPSIDDAREAMPTVAYHSPARTTVRADGHFYGVIELAKGKEQIEAGEPL